MRKVKLDPGSFLVARGLNATHEMLESYPEEYFELSDEQLECVAGGVLNAVDIAYCHVAVEFYHSKGYSLERMQKEMTDYQNTLRSKGQTTLADRSAEYLAYMTRIW